MKLILNPDLVWAVSQTNLGALSLFTLLACLILLVFFRKSLEMNNVIVSLLLIAGGISFVCTILAQERDIEIKETNSELLHAVDENCYKLVGDGMCDVWVTWTKPSQGMQVIIRAGENNEDFFACGGIPDGINKKLAVWVTPQSPTIFRYFQVSGNGPNYGCTDTKPKGEPLAQSKIIVR